MGIAASNVAVTNGSAVKLVSARVGRKLLRIRANSGANVVFIGDNTVSSVNGYNIANEVLNLDGCVDEVWAIASGTTVNVAAVEVF